jgi:hypothetical protein
MDFLFYLCFVMALVYQHIRKDNNKVFYIGIGVEEKRAFSKEARNPMWWNIVNKADYIVEVIHDSITWEEACILEKFYIKKYGRKDNGTGILSNMTDGGDGVIGLVFTNETRFKLSQSRLGKKLSEHALECLRNRIISDETRKKMSEKAKGKEVKKETRDKLSQINTGKQLSLETKEKIQQSMLGDKNHFFGKTHNDDSKIKISQNREGKCLGEENPSCKLTKDNVYYIKKNYKAKDKIHGCKPMAEKFSVSIGTIKNIISGKKWKHVVI